MAVSHNTFITLYVVVQSEDEKLDKNCRAAWWWGRQLMTDTDVIDTRSE